MMLEKGNGAPTLKEQLIHLIKKDIESGVYKEGDMLPREIDYQEKYDISRITVRSAIGELEAKGYVNRIKGKGTIVQALKVSEPLLKIEGFTEEMKAKGIIPTTKSAHIMITKAFGEVAEKLGVEEGTPVYRLDRIRCINGRAVVAFETYIKRDIALEMEDALYYGSLYHYLEDNHHIKAQKIAQSLTADLADQEIAKALECKVGEPILLLKRVGYDEKYTIFEYTQGRYVARRYEYYFELER